MSLLEELKIKKSIVDMELQGGQTPKQYCGINQSLLDYIIDDAPMKHGYFTPGSHLKIFSRDILKQNKPDYILIFAWSFFNEIIEKNIKYLHEGVKFIIPCQR